MAMERRVHAEGYPDTWGRWTSAADRDGRALFGPTAPSILEVMAKPGPKTHLASVEDLLRLPDDVRAEVVGGELVEKEAANFDHSASQGQLAAHYAPFHRRGGGSGPGGWWIGTEVEIEYETHEVYRHDLAGWRRERVPERPRGRAVQIHPDWACEILSPSNWANDTVAKFKTLRRHGIPHYWIVDIEHGVLTVYRFGNGLYSVAAIVRPGERARLEPFAEIEVEVGLLLGLDPADD